MDDKNGFFLILFFIDKEITILKAQNLCGGKCLFPRKVITRANLKVVFDDAKVKVRITDK